MATETSKRSVYVSPKTNKTYRVTYGNFQTAFVYEFDGDDIEEVTKSYDSSQRRCETLWHKQALAFNAAAKNRRWKTAAQEALDGPNADRTTWRRSFFEYAQTVETNKVAPKPVAVAR